MHTKHRVDLREAPADLTGAPAARMFRIRRSSAVGERIGLRRSSSGPEGGLAGSLRRAHRTPHECDARDSLMERDEWTGWDLNPRPPACKAGDATPDLPARAAEERKTIRLIRVWTFDRERHPTPRSDEPEDWLNGTSEHNRFGARRIRPRWLSPPRNRIRSPDAAEATPGENGVGGDPSAGSPTDTLLRLNPACGPQVRVRQEPDPHLELTRMV